MRAFIVISLFLIFANSGQAQPKKTNDTLVTRFSNHGKVSGDTSFFKYIPVDLTRFFLRNLRMDHGPNGYTFGYCTLYFVIDTAGVVTKAWCEDVTNDHLAKEALRIAGKLTSLQPTYIHNRPAITKVKVTMAFVDSEKITEEDKQKDIWLMAYPVQR